MKIRVTFRAPGKRGVGGVDIDMEHNGSPDDFIAKVRAHCSDARPGLTATWTLDGAKHTVMKLRTGISYKSIPLR